LTNESAKRIELQSALRLSKKLKRRARGANQTHLVCVRVAAKKRNTISDELMMKLIESKLLVSGEGINWPDP